MKSAYLFFIGLFFGVGLGFLLAVTNDVQMETHDHDDPAAHGAGTGYLAHDTSPAHAHTMLDITQDPTPKPEIAIALHPDSGQSYNLQVSLKNFSLAPAQVNGPHQPGQGHAHIFVDGVKLTRLYGEWFLLSDLPAGAEVKVTLNANSHEALMHSGQMIEATVQVPAPSGQ